MANTFLKIINRKKTFYLTAFCFINSINTAKADNSADLFNLTLEQLLDITVTTPAKTNQRMQQAPSSISVFSSTNIEALGLQTLEELLNYVSGVQYHRDGLGSQVNFRSRASDGNDILVLLNGIRLNDPISASAFIGFQNISLFAIEKVEIIKGPGSSLYGSNAYNGIISLTTKENAKEFNFGFGSFESQFVRSAMNFHGENWKIDLNLETSSDEGQYYPAFFNFFGHLDPTQDPISGNHSYLLAELYNLTINAGQHNRLSEDFVFTSQGNGINKLDVNSNYIQLKYAFAATDTVNFNFSLEQVVSEQSTVLLQLPADVAATFWSNGAITPFIGGNYKKAYSRRVTADGSWQQSDISDWIFGLEFRQEKSDEITFQGNWDPEINRTSNGFTFIPKEGEYTRELWWFGNYQPLVPHSSRKINSIYLQDNLQLSEQWQLTIGGHYDDYEDVGSDLSIRGGLINQYSEKTTFKLLYGEAFRAPTLFELNALIATGLIGNPELKPETVDTFELVWLQDWGKVQSSVTYYQSKFTNVIEQVTVDDIVSGFASFQPQNMGDLDLTGWEIDLKAKLSERFTLSASYSHANEYVKLGSADTTSSLSFNFHQNKLNVNLSGIFHANILSRLATVEQQYETYIDSFWLAKLHSTYALTNNIKLLFTINNLFDENYYGYSVSNGLEQGSPNRERNWMLSLKWKY